MNLAVNPLRLQAEELARSRQRNRPTINNSALVTLQLRDDDPDGLSAACGQVGARSENRQLAVPGERADLGEQHRPGALGCSFAGIVDRRIKSGHAALHQDRKTGGVPAAGRRRVSGTHRLPGQSGCGCLLAHRINQDLGHVQLDSTVFAGQDRDRAIQLSRLDAKGEEGSRGCAPG